MRDVYAQVGPSKKTAQNLPALDKDQVRNNAGGYVFKLDKFTSFEKFLILGTEGGTYYVSEQKLTLDNVQSVIELMKTDGVKAVEMIRDISLAGRAPRQNPTLYSLALAIKFGDLETRHAAYSAISEVCRTGTMFFTFVGYIDGMKGWSRGLRTAVSNWYLKKPTASVAYQAIKYRRRDNWTHRDVLRLSHPKTNEVDRRILFDFICGREVNDILEYDSLHIVEGYQKATQAPNPGAIAKLISEYNLPWEAIPTNFLNSVEVWNALLDNKVGITALLRNLNRLTNLEILKPLGGRTKEVADRLRDVEELKKGRVHPLSLLDTALTYGDGHGVKGNLVWTPVQSINEALEDAFYASFATVEPTNKRTLLGIDVSGSMGYPVLNGFNHITPRVGSVALALITAHVEPEHYIMGFTGGFIDLKITNKDSLQTAFNKTNGLPFDRTDCALPFLWAKKSKAEVDSFITYTDSETWAGGVHPFQALSDYRQSTGIQSKSVVCGMASNGFSIADPADAGSMDVVGFDTVTPRVIADFCR